MSNLQLKFFKPDVDSISCVRADTIVIAVRSVQRALKLMGELAENPVERGAVSKRKNPPRVFFRQQPKPRGHGSLLDFHILADPGDLESHKAMLEAFSLLLSSVREGNLEPFTQKFGGDSKLPEVLGSMIRVSNLCPNEAKIILQHKENEEFNFFENKRNLRHAKKSIESIASSQKLDGAKHCIIAKMKSVDFEDSILRFEHSSSRIPLSFCYAGRSPSMQKRILETLKSRNNHIELHGDIKFDKSGRPKGIKSLAHIKLLDLRKITVTEVRTKSGIIAPHKPLVYKPELDDSGADIKARIDDPLGDTLFDTGRDYLVEQIEKYFSFLWDDYAMEEDRNLDHGAQWLKGQTLKMFVSKGEEHDCRENQKRP